MYNAYLYGTTVYRIPEYRYNGVIFHYGIEGQRWGVRRFQNSDGSVKPAGAQRYYSEYGDNYKRSDDPKNKPGAVKSDNTKASEQSPSKKGMSENTKKKLKTAAKVGVAFVAAAAAAYTVNKVNKVSKDYKDIAEKVAKEWGNKLEKDANAAGKTMSDKLEEIAKSNNREYSKSQRSKDRKKYKEAYLDNSRGYYKKKAKEIARSALKEKYVQSIRDRNSFNRAFDKRDQYKKYYK